MLYQLSYTPGFGCIVVALSGHRPGMTEHEHEHERPQDADVGKPVDDDLLEEQEGKGYGEDEGERDESLPDAG